MDISEYSYKYVPTVRLFAHDDTFIRVIIGPVGSGKSVGSGVIEIVNRALNQAPGPDGKRRTKCAIVRNTYPELQDTTMKTFFEWIVNGVHGDYQVAKKTFMLNKVRMDNDPYPGAPVECEIRFIALDEPDDVKHLLSMELTFVWFNELREIAKAIFDMMDARVGRFPPMKDGGPTWCGMFGDTNPPDTDHWLYKLLEEDSRIYPADHPKSGQLKIGKYHQASGLAVHPDGIYGVPIAGLHAENLPNLRVGYYQDFAVGKDQDFIDVYIHANYGYVKDGKPVYTNWNNRWHVSKTPVVIVRNYPLLVGWDFGYDFASCVMGQYLPIGRFQLKHEFLSESMGARRFAQDIIKPFIFANYLGMDIIGTGDLYGKGHAPSDESTCFQELIDAGLPAEPAITNAWQPRFSSVDSFLTKQVNIEGQLQPAFLVDPEMKLTIKGFDGEYKFKRIFNQRMEMYSDKPVKNKYSHPHDAIQYIAMFVDQGLMQYRRRKPSNPNQPSKPTWRAMT